MFAQNLVAARKARKLTISGLARKAGLHRITVHYLETGAREPSMKSLDLLATALGVDAAALLRTRRRARRSTG